MAVSSTRHSSIISVKCWLDLILSEQDQSILGMWGALLNDSVEVFLRRDYYLADSIVDKTEGIRSLENEIVLFLNRYVKI